MSWIPATATATPSDRPSLHGGEGRSSGAKEKRDEDMSPRETRRRTGDRTTTRRGGKRRNQDGPPKPKIADAGTRRVLTTLLKSTLMNTQAVREFKGILLDTYILPIQHPVVLAVQEAGRSYATAVRQEGKGHGHGPPALASAAALI